MDKTKLSKTVSYILRHHPESFDLKLAADASVKTDKILASGIKPMGRNYVHLSVGVKEAEKVARRRTEQPVIFKIKALKAFREGQNFYQTAEDIFLTDQLSAAYLSLLKNKS